MKVLTVRQPWAALIATGVKGIETRSWMTLYTGPLAIHSSARYSIEDKWLAQHNPYIKAALAAEDADLPCGVILAVATLVRCERIFSHTHVPSLPEYAFGDYTTGRYMWHLSDLRRLVTPIPATGRLGLWDYTIPGFD